MSLSYYQWYNCSGMSYNFSGTENCSSDMSANRYVGRSHVSCSSTSSSNISYYLSPAANAALLYAPHNMQLLMSASNAYHELSPVRLYRSELLVNSLMLLLAPIYQYTAVGVILKHILVSQYCYIHADTLHRIVKYYILQNNVDIILILYP